MNTRVDCRNGYVDSTQCSDLIVHESKQGRNDDGDTVIDNCWKLETQALARVSVRRGSRLASIETNYPNEVAVED